MADRAPFDYAVVTGCAGFVGYHLAASLIEDGWAVLGIDNFDPFYDVALKRRNAHDLETLARARGASFRLLEKDLNDVTQADLAVPRGTGGPSPGAPVDDRPSIVFHLAAKAGVQPSVKHPLGHEHTNVRGTLHLLELCREMGVERVVFASSSSVYGKESTLPFAETARADSPISPYAASKRAAELFCHAHAALYGLRIAVLRYFTVYGPRQRPDLAVHAFLRTMLAGGTLTLFDADRTGRDYTFVADIVAGTRLAGRWTATAEAGACEVFNIGSGRLVSLLELVRALEAVSGLTATVQAEHRPLGDMSQTLADLGKSERILGYRPQVELVGGIEAFHRWYLATLPS